MRPSACIALLLLSAACIADESAFEYGGHTKLNLQAATYPDDSLLKDLLGSDSSALQGDLRVNLEWRDSGWSADAAYQLIAIESDRIGLTGGLPATPLPVTGLINDDRRFLDLTKVIHESGDTAVLHRLDRAWFGYASDTTVVRIGRQALSWGNGFFYAPMDLVNPFDPATIDTEYKAGDDMLYTQFLRGNGDDFQGAIVARRDPLTGDVESDQVTVALKYHGFGATREYDVLVADSYGDAVIGIGIGQAIGGAQWSTDLVVTDTDADVYAQLVTNLSYSWTLADRNMTGLLEYHFNGFGQSNRRYAPADLATNPDLLARLARGQSFTLGRHYAAASVTVEMTPLWNVSPVLLANLEDPSALLQLTSSYSLSDNMTLLGNINIPIGPSGSEFGGIDTGGAGRYLSTGAGLFAQFAWYF